MLKLLTKLIVSIILAFIAFGCADEKTIEPETLTDADGNIYNTITLGEQVWMLENLKTTKFNDGTPITAYTFGNDWHNGNTPTAYYEWPETSDLNNVVDEELPFDYYGAMYNHFAIESGKLAPQGWRIPTEADFIALENHLASLGYDGNEATVLKSESGWLPSSGSGTNDVGFNGLPNGYINAFGGATLAEGICTWATTDLNSTNGTRRLVQLFDQDEIFYSDNAIQIGAGIRCIKE